MEYIVKPGQAIWHTGEKRYYDAGAQVKLDHLPERDRELLVKRGIVAPAGGEVEAAPAEPVKAAAPLASVRRQPGVVEAGVPDIAQN